MHRETSAVAVPTDLPPIALRNAVESFLLRCKAQNLSPLTLGWYKGILGALTAFLREQEVDEIRAVTRTHIRTHLTLLREAGHGSGTVFRTYGALRCFFSFLSRERLIPTSPMILRSRGKERTFIQALNIEQMRLLLAQPDKSKYVGLRAWTMMVLILDTGLRVSEVLKLRRNQVSVQSNTLRVMGKGGKEREVPFGSSAKQALWQYSVRVGEITGQDLFFVDQFGRGLDARWLQLQLREYGRVAGIQGVRVSPHTLRHRFATQYILNGGDAFSLQKILGHSCLDMVRVYVDLANRDVALQHKRFSPIDHLGSLNGIRRVIIR